MDRQEALARAREIASAIAAAAARSPEGGIYEILIYGSIARGERTVWDIDMIVLDNGAWSRNFPLPKNVTSVDWYRMLRGNCCELLHLMRCDQGETLDFIEYVNIDMHVLPLKLLTDRSFRQEVAVLHQDPYFFKNVFSAVLRRDPDAGTFGSEGISYFEMAYGTDLSDLK